MSEPIPEGALRICENYESLGGLKPDGKYYPYRASGDSVEKLTAGRGHLLTVAERAEYLAGKGKFIGGMTLDQVNQLFAQDCAPRWQLVLKTVAGSPNEKGAFFSATFNCPDILSGSPAELHKRGRKVEAATRWLLYRNGSGKPLRGLWRRRLVEALYYLTGEVEHIGDPCPKWPATSPEENRVIAKLVALGVKVRDVGIWPKQLY